MLGTPERALTVLHTSVSIQCTCFALFWEADNERNRRMVDRGFLVFLTLCRRAHRLRVRKGDRR